MFVTTSFARPRARWYHAGVLLHLAAGASVSLFVSTSAASAQGVARGRELFYAAEFEAAAEVFEAALAAPSLRVADAIEAHRFLSAVRSLEDRRGLALQHAEAAVLLDPTVTAPPGASRLGDLFDEARERTGAEPARLRIEVESTNDAQIVRAQLAPYAVLLAVRTRIECRSDDGSERVEELAGPTAEIELAGAPADWTCTCAALTAGGARLLTARRALDAAEDDGVPWAWIALGAGGAALVLAAAIATVALLLPSDEVHVGPLQFR